MNEWVNYNLMPGKSVDEILNLRAFVSSRLTPDGEKVPGKKIAKTDKTR